MSIDSHFRLKTETYLKEKTKKTGKTPTNRDCTNQERRKSAGAGESSLAKRSRNLKKAEESGDEEGALIYKAWGRRFDFRGEPLRGVPSISPNVPSRSPNVSSK